MPWVGPGIAFLVVAAAGAAQLPAAPAAAPAPAHLCGAPPGIPGLAGLNPCTFFSPGAAIWYVRERACTPPREPLVPAPTSGQDPTIQLIASCPAPFGAVPPGTVMWTNGSADGSIVADGGGARGAAGVWGPSVITQLRTCCLLAESEPRPSCCPCVCPPPAASIAHSHPPKRLEQRQL